MTKKIINGKKYDVETARLVDRWTYGNPSDFYYQDEMLLCKKTGEYFLYAQGGPLSAYRTYSGPNSWGGGEVIIPVYIRRGSKMGYGTYGRRCIRGRIRCSRRIAK